MGGSGGFFDATLDTWNKSAGRSLITGIGGQVPNDGTGATTFTGAPDKFWYLGEDSTGFENLFAGVFPSLDADTTEASFSKDAGTHYVNKFGLLLATAYAYGKEHSVPESEDDDDYGVTYVKGPFYKAAENIGAWEDVTIMESLITSSLPAWTSEVFEAQDAVYMPGDTDVPQKLATLLSTNTDTYISGVSDFDDFMALFTAPADDNGWAAVYAAIGGSNFDIAEISAGTITAPEAFSPYDIAAAPTITEPSSVEIVLDLDALAAYEPTTRPTIDDPDPVTVTDAITAAIAAFSSELDTRYAAEEGQLGQTLLGTRSTSAGSLDVALATLTTRKTKELEDYTAKLRLEQTKMNADLASKYQDQLIEVGRFNGEFSLRFDELLQRTDNVTVALNDLRFRLGSANAEFDQRYVDAVMQREKMLGDYAMQIVQFGQRQDDQELQDAGQRLQASIAQIQADLQADTANEAAKTEHLRAHVLLAGSMFDAVSAWMHNKALILSNAGPMADIIKTGVMSEMGESQFQRELWLKRESERYRLASMVSGAYASKADLEFKSVIQNQMVIKEAMATLGVAYAGTERNSSGFENLMQGMGLAFSGAGAVGNIAAMFG